MTETKEDIKQDHMLYYPFNNILFKKKTKYNGLKYKNMGIRRSVHWRQGYPTTKMGKYAGAFVKSGHKRKKHLRKSFRMMRAKQIQNWV